MDGYSAGELEKYKVLFLTGGSVDANSVNILRSYKGTMIPDILNSKTSISENDISDMFNSLKGTMIPVDNQYRMVDFDNYELDLEGNYSGWLVLSEKFSQFPGWDALADGKRLSILEADGIISAYYLDSKPESISLSYKPSSFIIGSWITAITALLVAAYFIYILYRKYKNLNRVHD